MTSPALTIVIADANVLINLMHVEQLDLCSKLPGLRFVLPDHVQEEVRIPTQRAKLESAIGEGLLEVVSIAEPADICFFAQLTTHLGRGESACLVLAVRNGWTVASDERRRFRREATQRIGPERILGTADLYVRAIRTGCLTIEQADADKEVLETRRFKMRFPSFRELLATDADPGPGSR